MFSAKDPLLGLGKGYITKEALDTKYPLNSAFRGGGMLHRTHAA
jgi:hypothetical protein